MEPLGPQELQEPQIFSMESPTGTANSWQWVYQESSLPLLMESRGLQGLLEHQTICMESPLSEAHLPYPIRKTLPLLRDTTEKVFQSGVMLR